jgi:GTP:adenosylcobinamide-phosphate guanylyltransferase
MATGLVVFAGGRGSRLGGTRKALVQDAGLPALAHGLRLATGDVAEALSRLT